MKQILIYCCYYYLLFILFITNKVSSEEIYLLQFYSDVNYYLYSAKFLFYSDITIVEGNS